MELLVIEQDFYSILVISISLEGLSQTHMSIVITVDDGVKTL